MRIDKCHLCASSNVRQSRAGYNECVNCGLLFKKPIDVIDYNLAYSHSESFDYIGYENDQWYSWDLLKAEICRSIILQHNLRCIFDFGCGSGKFLSACQEKSIDQLSGFEVSTSALRLARQALMSDSIYNTFEEAYFALPHNGLATFFEVIEHLDDFSPIRSLIMKGFHIYGTTGNHHSFVSKIRGENWEYLMPQHCSIFSTRSLMYMANMFDCNLDIRYRNILPRRSIFNLSSCLPLGPFNSTSDLIKYFLPSSTLTFHFYPK